MVIIPGLVCNVELAWEHEVYRRTRERIGKYVRVLEFDKRGMASSDRFGETPTLEQRIDDIKAVMDAEGIGRAHVLGVSEGGIMACATWTTAKPSGPPMLCSSCAAMQYPFRDASLPLIRRPVRMLRAQSGVHERTHLPGEANGLAKSIHRGHRSVDFRLTRICRGTMVDLCHCACILRGPHSQSTRSP